MSSLPPSRSWRLSRRSAWHNAAAMAHLADALRRLAELGIDASDSDETRVSKGTFVIFGIAAGLAGMAWTLLYLALGGRPLAASIPSGFTVIIAVVLVYYARSRRIMRLPDLRAARVVPPRARRGSRALRPAFAERASSRDRSPTEAWREPDSRHPAGDHGPLRGYDWLHNPLNRRASGRDSQSAQ